MNDNMKIWDDLFKTDPDHTKPITGKSYGGTSIKPQYVMMRLTEQFGPVGSGFGWRVIREEYIDGKPHEECREKIHELRIMFWWRDVTGKIFEVESYGATKALYKTNKGYWTDDEDAAKKSLTDAIVKAASWLGVGGDIFMGRWDDSKYVSELRHEKEREAVAEKEAAEAIMVNQLIGEIESAESVDDLRTVWTRYGGKPAPEERKAAARNPKCIEARDKRKAELEGKTPFDQEAA